MRRFIVFLLGFVYIMSIPAFGLSSADWQSLYGDSIYYLPQQNQCSTIISGPTPASGSTNVPLWNSNVQPPYYLESFVINVLEALAQAEGVPQSDTLTQQHVLALVAWSWAEGGNIGNSNLFNPWNTGLNDPALLSTANSGDGNQSFKSFDAGVTGAVITFIGPSQDRIAGDLINPNSTALDFINALTYYQHYSGNDFWAQADQEDQTGYYSTLVQVLQQTAQNYGQEATVQLGSPGNTLNESHVSTSLLKYSDQSNDPGSTTSTGDGSCSGGDNVNCSSLSDSSANLSQVRQNVVCTAEQQLALWKSQPGYGNAYPGFPYAATGYLGYSQQRVEEWCADFASWVYNQAGDPLQTPDWDLPGVAEIYNITNGSSKFTWHPGNSNYTPVPGDLALHAGSDGEFSHVNIVTAVNGKTITYIGGDAGSGPYPGGSIVAQENDSNDVTGYVSPN